MRKRSPEPTTKIGFVTIAPTRSASARIRRNQITGGRRGLSRRFSRNQIGGRRTFRGSSSNQIGGGGCSGISGPSFVRSGGGWNAVSFNRLPSGQLGYSDIAYPVDSGAKMYRN